MQFCSEPKEADGQKLEPRKLNTTYYFAWKNYKNHLENQQINAYLGFEKLKNIKDI